MNLLYIGLMYDKENEKKLINNSKSGLGIASNILQQNILKGINNNEHSIQVQSYLPVGNFPKLNSKYYYKRSNYIIDHNIKVNELKTFNIPILKNIQRLIDSKKEVSKWLNEIDESESKVIIIYDLYLPFLQLIKWVKKEHEDVTVLLIVPDLIGKFRNQQVISNLYDKIINKMSKDYINLMNKADGFIIVSEQIANFINEKPYLVINGIVSEPKEEQYISHTEAVRQGKTIFMYAGLLSKQYEVDKMALTFHELNNTNCELWICGYGELENEFKNNKFKNVKYFGILPKEEVERLEKYATAMINPRPNIGEYTKYSFPSKNLEYLVSGKPVITHKLDSFSNKFDEVFDYIDNNREDLTAKISYYANLNRIELKTITNRNREFALKHFEVDVQGKKIDEFISEIAKKK